MVRFLEKQGFAIIRVRGSHHFLTKGDQRTFCPRPCQSKSESRHGAPAFLRDIGLSPTEFEETSQGLNGRSRLTAKSPAAAVDSQTRRPQVGLMSSFHREA